MLQGKKILGVVLARAGSKGLPGKNSKYLAGKPLLQYTLEAGIGSQFIDDIVISTDCDSCITIAHSLGVKVPFKRPDILSGDTVASADVLIHALEHLQILGEYYDYFILLEPTSPLRNSHDIDSALELMFESNSSALVSVCQAEDQHPDFMFTISGDGKLIPYSKKKFEPIRRQDICSSYYLDGSVYISAVDVFFRERTFCHHDTGYFVVPKWKAFEIDDIWDFVCIEAIMKYRKRTPEMQLSDEDKSKN